MAQSCPTGCPGGDRDQLSAPAREGWWIIMAFAACSTQLGRSLRAVEATTGWRAARRMEPNLLGVLAGAWPEPPLNLVGRPFQSTRWERDDEG